MSPILGMQARFRELGRLRMGQQVPLGGDRQGTRPEKLETWRLTSPSEELLQRAAAIYEGEVRRWEGAPEGEEWELYTKSKTLDIVVPPGQVISQWNEMWSGGGCVRRCDGQREMLTDKLCLCPEDPAERNELAGKGKACKPTTRLSVILPNIPDVGIWLLVSHGWNAAAELLGTANLLAAAGAAGRTIPASLRIKQKTQKRPGQVTHHFGVPVIEVPDTTFAELAAGPGNVAALLAAGPTKPPTPTGEVPLPADPAFGKSMAAAAIGQSVVEGEFRMPAEAPPPPITYAEFKDLLAASGMDVERVKAAHASRFPTGPSTKGITDEQRGRLWADLTRVPVGETPAAPARTAEPSAAPPVADGPPGTGLDLTALTNLLHASDVAFPFAEAKAAEMFGEKLLDRLTGPQRYRLATELGLFEEGEPDAP